MGKHAQRRQADSANRSLWLNSVMGGLTSGGANPANGISLELQKSIESLKAACALHGIDMEVVSVSKEKRNEE